ncbi:putative callose synthase 6 isoform X4 [Triticum urartu]|uniref:putative callose synthase 6 isoform X4 n=1 Tax=Triticum urartu TaxID=4572 RepID=UPI00204472B2|nr:putative callose synthase 6 isoform X4 [Triticum urartu]
MSMSSGGDRPSTSRPPPAELQPYSGEGSSVEDEESELVPASLAPIVPILRAAKEIEEENPRVAYLCRTSAYKKAHEMDPNSAGRGVLQFKTNLLYRLKKDEEETHRSLTSNDAEEIKRLYEEYCRKYLLENDLPKRKPDEMARYYQIASILYGMIAAPNFEEREDRNGELMPASLAPIFPILHAAKEIEEENPRVAYLCRFTAYGKAHKMDPNSREPGVLQFKTHLLHRLKKDKKQTRRRLASNDAEEIKRFYEEYRRKYIFENDLPTRKSDEMARYYQIASVLYDMTVTPNFEESEDEKSGDEESDLVPASLVPIVPILRAAKEIEEENPRVAYLCRFTAFEYTHKMDPHSSGRGVRQFRTYLLHRLEKDEMETSRRLASTDAKEILKFYEQYCRKNLEGLHMRKSDKMSRYYQVASVLYDVLNNVAPGSHKSMFDQFAKGVEKEKASFSHHYNMLPLNIPGPPQPVMEIPEIKAAVDLLRGISNLPIPRQYTTNVPEAIEGPIVHDLIDWLRQTFGFQKGNMENQKEHLILLLANVDMKRSGGRYEREGQSHMIDHYTIDDLMKKVFQNYISWCMYLHLESNIKISDDASTQQHKLLYIGLYLLIWGEASSVRFMPECLCYIFHHMARDLYDIICSRRESSFDPVIYQEGRDDAFLQLIIQPIYNVIQNEAVMSKNGTVCHSKWRNYDDLNEYFWSKKVFKKLGWPMDPASDFFTHHIKNNLMRHDYSVSRRRISKTNFSEVHTFLHLFKSFDRMWYFFILAFQAMVIIAWSPSGSLFAIFEPDVFRNVMTIFITSAFLNFLQATLEIVLNWKAWRNLLWSQMIRRIFKFFVALGWFIILPVTYSTYIQNPTGLMKFFSNSIGNFQSQSIYNFAVALYMLPNIISALFFIFRPMRRTLEHSNYRTIRFLLWWTQPELYVARGMYEDTCSCLKYTTFWILLLICKLTFSYYVEVYLMDTQIWYAIFSTICGRVNGAFSRLGEIQTLGMLTSRFYAISRAFGNHLVPGNGSLPKRHELQDDIFLRADKFSNIWNAFILSLRDEDLISNRERYLLIFPTYVGDVGFRQTSNHIEIMNKRDQEVMVKGGTSVFQWPIFLLASKIPIALEKARSVKKRDAELLMRIKQDPYTYYAVIECYEALLDILYSLVAETSDKKVLDRIYQCLEYSIHNRSLVRDFRLGELPQVTAKFDKLLSLLLKNEHAELDTTIYTQIAILLQDTMEIITQDIMTNGQGILKDENRETQLFANLNLDLIKDESWRGKCVRLQQLMTAKESAICVPNLEARRRITFFANSLFMKMPTAPQVRRMMSFSVLTPYFKEEVLFSKEDLHVKNEDGISILFYLRKTYIDEWKNFLERIKFVPKDEESLESRMDEISLWASYRGQTLTRTVRGMMYYRRALEIQYIHDKTDIAKLDRQRTTSSYQEGGSNIVDMAMAITDIKFTYVVSCQVYGKQKASKDPREKNQYLNILNLMIMYPSLRIAYIDEIEAPNRDGMIEKTYYSVLVKGVGEKYNEEIYRIKLPGKPTHIGEGKPENQNHALIFTRGEAIQVIDVNQDNYLEEAFKMRNLLEEFESKKYGNRKPTILGLREHLFTGSVSSLSRFMSNQENSFFTIGQRVLANPLKVRFHYGHPDIFDRIFHITRGGISKASKTINLSHDIFSGFNSTMREGNITHHEYMQVGKGRDVRMNEISSFEAKVANGNGEQTLSRDVYRLGQRFDFYRMLSFYFTTVGFYFSSMVIILTVYVFLYGRLYLVLSGLEMSILLDPRILENINSLENAMALESVFQLGLLLLLPILMEIGLEKGFRKALGEFVIMQLQLAPIFFTFQLGTKTHYYGRTILHGCAQYRPTGRGFVVCHAKFADNYRMYSRSHFVKGFELLILLVVYIAYGSSYDSSNLYLFVTFTIWFLVGSWLFAPFIFNPSCFEWHKTVDDWTDWRNWMGNRGGIGMSVEQSWEAWWIGEQDHLRKTSIRGLLFEIILSLRFLIYQYGIVYHLNIAHGSKSILVYAFSWLVMLTVLVVLKILSIGRQKFGTDMQCMFHIIKGLLFLGFLFVMVVLFVVYHLTISDVFASILGFVPTGWWILLIGQACSPLVKKTMLWDSIMELGRAYDNIMGLILFLPIGFLSWFPFISEFQTRFLFNQAFSRGLQISSILRGQKDIGEFDRPVSFPSSVNYLSFQI